MRQAGAPVLDTQHLFLTNVDGGAGAAGGFKTLTRRLVLRRSRPLTYEQLCTCNDKRMRMPTI